MPSEAVVELKHISRALIVKTGITNADGVTNELIKDSVNLTEPINYWINMLVVILDGTNQGLVRRIVSTYGGIGGGEILVVYPDFPFEVMTGTSYSIISNIIASSNTTPKPYIVNNNHINNTNEQTLYSLPSGALLTDYDIAINMSIDVSNLTQNTIIREYTWYAAVPLQISAKTFPTDFDPGTKVINISFKTGQYYKITLQSVIAEGSDKTVQYWYNQVINT